MKVRVAVLISGLIRTFEESFETFKKNIMDSNPEYSFDFYLTFWDETHSRNDDEIIKTKINVETEQRLLSLYKPVFFEKLSYDDHRNKLVNDSTNLKIYNILNKRISLNGWGNYGKNFVWNGFFMQHCCRYRNMNNFVNYSESMGLEYDLVLNCRFDLSYTNIFTQDVNPTILNCPIDNQYFGIIDFFAISNKEIMKKYNSVFLSLRDENFIENCPVNFPEDLLREHLIKNNIEFKNILPQCTIIR